jgi:cysteinyl-tRNA synthetase
MGAMQISLTNTMTRRKEPFVPADPKRVTMYVCGSTVYNHPHIGNARPAVVFDVLFRLLRAQYGESAVLYASNYTDIDDKIIRAAAEAGVPIDVITDKFARIYRQDMAALNVLTPTFEPRATAHVDDMIALIEKLIVAGIAYKGEHGVWFSVSAAKARDLDYGKLSKRPVEDSEEGYTAGEYYDKREGPDFALWKAAKPGEPSWAAPFGRGRPGWHIECSAMIAAQLGETIDIHGGGLDLVFPHHENEIAQSESANHAPLARVWMHNGMLNMDKEKMSKSIGNIVTVRELLDAGWQGETIRWALLSGHYRAPLDWSDDLLRQAQASLDRLYGALLRLKDAPTETAQPSAAIVDALSDDLNTPAAIAALSALVTTANNAKKPAEHAAAKAELLAAAQLIGVLHTDPEHWFRASFGAEAAAEIDALVAERVAARAAKNWAEADRLRDVLAAKGVEVMDGPSGSTWRRRT